MEKQELENRLRLIKQKLNLTELKKKIEEIELEMGDPNFWLDQDKSRSKTQELSDLKKDVDELEMLELYLEEDDLTNLEKSLLKLELKTFLSGKYDKSNALLSIHAGQGGTEAMDWAQMLERMYLRYAEKKGWTSEVLDSTPGDEAGIKSATIRIQGPYAYGYLRGEAGAHRLVRQSPFNADKLRQTSFAKVEVLPEIEDAGDLEIKDDELEWEFFRSSSQGGQNVQKVSTAVRVKHKPTGLIVTCQTERFQEQNRKIALSLLRGKLWELRLAEEATEERKLKGEERLAGWGNQIRSYVLHPYKMVKDLRTQVERSDPEKVLDGDLDLFIEAELKSMVY